MKLRVGVGHGKELARQSGKDRQARPKNRDGFVVAGVADHRRWFRCSGKFYTLDPIADLYFNVFAELILIIKSVSSPRPSWIYKR